MLRVTLATLTLALVACGQEAGQGGTPPVSAGSEAAAPQVERCLDLVRQDAFGRALSVCEEALSLDPSNQDVQAALEKAKVRTAQ